MLANYLTSVLELSRGSRYDELPLLFGLCAKESAMIQSKSRTDRLGDMNFCFSQTSTPTADCFSVDDILLKDRFHHTILVGAAGSGKSLLAVQLAALAARACLAQMHAPDTDEASGPMPPVPLLVPVLDMLRRGTNTISRYLEGISDFFVRSSPDPQCWLLQLCMAVTVLC